MPEVISGFVAELTNARSAHFKNHSSFYEVILKKTVTFYATRCWKLNSLSDIKHCNFFILLFRDLYFSFSDHCHQKKKLTNC